MHYLKNIYNPLIDGGEFGSSQIFRVFLAPQRNVTGLALSPVRAVALFTSVCVSVGWGSWTKSLWKTEELPAVTLSLCLKQTATSSSHWAAFETRET